MICMEDWIIIKVWIKFYKTIIIPLLLYPSETYINRRDGLKYQGYEIVSKNCGGL